MRTLSRALFAAAAAAVVTAAPAQAGTLTPSLKPNKGGSLTVAAPTTFSLTSASTGPAYDTSGNTRLKAIKALLPEQLLFNQQPFKYCDVASFIANKTCPSATKLGTTDLTVDAGPDFPNPIPAKATLYFGAGYTVLAYVEATQPAVIQQAVVGELRSSGVRGYGLQIYIPVPAEVSVPLEGVYPSIRTLKATVAPPTKSVKVPGEKKKVKLPLAGLGQCKGALNFRVDYVYTDAAGVIDKTTETSTGKASCKQ